MKKILNRKTCIILYLFVILVTFVFIYLYTQYIIFVDYIEHGLLISKSDKGSNFHYEFLVDGKNYGFDSIDHSIDLKPGIVNFKYRGKTIVKLMGYAQPIKEKVMSRSQDFIELEYSGSIKLDKGINVYKSSGKDTLIRSINSIISGANNVTVYKNNDGHIKTIILEGDTETEFIRVCLKNQDFLSIYHESLEFISDVALKVEDRISNKSYDIPEKTKITLTPADKSISIAFNDISDILRNRIYISAQNDQSYIKITSFKRGYGNPVYRGSFEITNCSGKLKVINEIPLESYLYQVVPSEMPQSFGLEALKAQAVAARTFALAELLGGAYAGLGYHVDDSTLTQVYNNISENSLANKAINETKGLVLKYNNTIIDAKFYSTSHGYGANANEIWSSEGQFPGPKIPYLTTKSYLLNGEQVDLSSEEVAYKFFKDWTIKSYDSDSPYFRWKASFTKDELLNTIEKNLPLIYADQKNSILTLVDGKFESKDIPEGCLGDLKDLKVSKRAEGGNIMELVIEGSKGTYKVIKELNVRYVLRPRKSDTGFDRDIVVKRIKSGDLKNIAMLPSAFMVFDITRDSNDNINDVTFYGGGYGHSVGMSQYGASYLASKGYKFDKILKTYYDDVTLEKLY